MFFSKSTGGFYTAEIHANMPSDVVPISQEEHVALITGQQAGKIIAADESGRPGLQAPPPPTVEQLAALERAWRDGELSTTDQLIARHRDERDMARPLTLSEGQFAELLGYRQALRDWPETPAFPDSDQRPVTPPWIAEQTP
ncbi:phage tail assembly chaperone [Pseudomonas guariconensis]|uniref:phage tail assembly chaperone n=1 Tax=Pseudomonas TaxID=286 RepID=UPI002097F3FB|nr:MULTISPECIES: phage tail assembly chaperone [Pseudomonas]MCO7516416.1 phage tail assembly chaperone [Pseudomonas putida]MCO7606684.1 phage tail assembly chaperone [Pseudomonas guariconensis]